MLGVTPEASADPTSAPTSGPTTNADPPPRRAPPAVGSAGFTPTWDLDGTYLWLGPSGAASHVDATWDSTIGGDAALVRVRERERVSVIGGAFGFARWTERGGFRLWLDGIAGTRVLGRTLGVSAGPLVELSDFSHPRLGAAVGIWGFVGITPFARIGGVQELGMFGEVGIHIALPVLRR